VDSDRGDLTFNSVGTDNICFFNPNSFGASATVSYLLEFDGSGLQLCTSKGCSSALTNGSHLLPGYYVFNASSVSNFRRLEIEISGRLETSEIPRWHSELKGGGSLKKPALAKLLEGDVVLPTLPFTAALSLNGVVDGSCSSVFSHG
jgi:hypothetical protein